MPPAFTQLYNFLNTPLVNNLIMILRIVFLVVSATLLGFIIFALIKTTWLRRMYIWDLKEFLTYRPYGVRKLYRQWQKIKTRLDTGLESEYKLAVIEADSITNDILKGMGFGGETLSERLEKITEATIPNLTDVLEAHKIRNNIVHDPDYRLALSEAKTVMDIYEKALTDLQAL